MNTFHKGSLQWKKILQILKYFFIKSWTQHGSSMACLRENKTFGIFIFSPFLFLLFSCKTWQFPNCKLTKHLQKQPDSADCFPSRVHKVILSIWQKLWLGLRNPNSPSGTSEGRRTNIGHWHIRYHPPETPKVTLPSVQNSPDVQQAPKNNLLIQIYSSVIEFDH